MKRNLVTQTAILVAFCLWMGGCAVSNSGDDAEAAGASVLEYLDALGDNDYSKAHSFFSEAIARKLPHDGYVTAHTTSLHPAVAGKSDAFTNEIISVEVEPHAALVKVKQTVNDPAILAVIAQASSGPNAQPMDSGGMEWEREFRLARENGEWKLNMGVNELALEIQVLEEYAQ